MPKEVGGRVASSVKLLEAMKGVELVVVILSFIFVLLFSLAVFRLC